MSRFTKKIIDKRLRSEIQRVFGDIEKAYSESVQILTEKDTLNILNNTITKFKHYQYSNIPQPVTVSLEIQALESLLKFYQKEKEKNKAIKNARFYVVGRRTGKEAEQKIILKEYINIDKISEKIEQLKQRREKYPEYSYEISYAIDRLQELLKEE